MTDERRKKYEKEYSEYLNFPNKLIITALIIFLTVVFGIIFLLI